jgi:hypothetical protein
MSRLSISTNSLLANRAPSRTQSRLEQLYVLIVLIVLNFADNSDKVRLFGMYRKKAPAFFRDCASGDVRPCRNQAQETLSQLCPSSRMIHLYICGRKAGEPSHYIILERDTHNGLWRLRTPRVYYIDSRIRMPHSGVKAYWSGRYTPLPETACGLSLHFSRVLAGGDSIRDLALEVANSYELRRMMTHGAVVTEVFGGFRDRLITLRESPGKVQFAMSTPDVTADPFITPFGFELVSISPYARKVTMPPVILWANATGEGLLVKQRPRSIQPQVKNAVEFKPKDSEAFGLIRELILSRLVPFVGVLKPDGTADILGLSYDPESWRSFVAVYARSRRSSAFAGIPQFRYKHERGIWIPNMRAVEVLKGLLFEESPDKEAQEARHYWLHRVFQWQGIGHHEDYPRAFEFWRQPLTDIQHASLLSRFNSNGFSRDWRD